MNPEQEHAITVAMDEYRTALRPVVEIYSTIARKFGRPESVPDVVNNDVRIAWDHLAAALAQEDAQAVAGSVRKALWHLVVARGDLLQLCIEIVRSDLDAMINSIVARDSTIDPRINEAVQANSQRLISVRNAMLQGEHPLPIDDPDGNGWKLRELNTVLRDYLELFGTTERLNEGSIRGAVSALRRVVLPFSEEQLRVTANLHQQYDVWIGAERLLAAFPFRMEWRNVGGEEQLFQIDRPDHGGTFLGPRSETTETRFKSYHTDRAAVLARRDRSVSRLADTCRLYQLLRLPLIAGEAATILREADRRSLLGSCLLVVGTSVVPAYSIEAAGRILDLPDETEDLDVAWTAEQNDSGTRPVWSMLKAVDQTYTVNTERPFQARNADAYEVEILVAPSRYAGMARGDQPRPVPLEEQEWLLNGRPIDHVVVARDGSPARIVGPDPRWFALQKLWLSVQDKRNPLKRDKDAVQGNAILNAVAESMPQYRLDAAFEADLPTVLAPIFQRWKLSHPPLPPAPIAW
jgi:hypothetical protein